MNKIEREQCHQVGSSQILGNYSRVRHLITDPQTKTIKQIWHQNTKAYVDQRLTEINGRIVQIKTGTTQNHCTGSQQNRL